MEKLTLLLVRTTGALIQGPKIFVKSLKLDKLVKASLISSGLIVLAILLGFFVSLFLSSLEFVKSAEFRTILSSNWDPIWGNYGAGVFIASTLICSFLALLISIPFSLSASIILSERTSDSAVKKIINNALDLLSAVPSVIYGFWGLFVLAPIIRYLQIKLGYPPIGVGLFTAIIVLTIMIIPLSVSISREVLKLVPPELEEAAFAMGATKAEVLYHISLPLARSGIIAGFVLSLGRALGETMAVTMVIGNFNRMPRNLFSPANTIASLIANQFNEASGAHQSALIFLGLVLFIITLLVNIAGTLILKGGNR
ncbi:MAG: phosphate ABC transporter permease subunit PstC [candidate division WOR-3 bacterium]